MSETLTYLVTSNGVKKIAISCFPLWSSRANLNGYPALRHRHNSPPKAELLVILSGAMAFMSFHDDGSPDTQASAFLHPTRGSLAVDCREGVWHTFFALEPDTVVCEVKAGPYDAAADKELAPFCDSVAGFCIPQKYPRTSTATPSTIL